MPAKRPAMPNPAPGTRLIRTDYSSPETTRAACSATLENAVRAAVVRLLSGQYTTADIHDLRFGTDNPASLAVHLSMRPNGSLRINWTPVNLFPRSPA